MIPQHADAMFKRRGGGEFCCRDTEREQREAPRQQAHSLTVRAAMCRTL